MAHMQQIWQFLIFSTFQSCSHRDRSRPIFCGLGLGLGLGTAGLGLGLGLEVSVLN